MLINVNELVGAALDYAVAMAEGMQATIKPNEMVYVHPNGEWHHNGNWRPSVNWVQAGPIIERERIDLQAKINAGSDYDEWLATIGIGSKQRRRYGPVPLIAAMRCYVASKMGNEVEIPDVLIPKP